MPYFLIGYVTLYKTRNSFSYLEPPAHFVEVESSIDAKGPSNTVAHDASFSSHDCKHSVGEPSSLITSAASELGKSSVHLGIAGPSISECTASGVSSGLGPPPSSLVGSLSPEKSTLNPNAKVCQLTIFPA